MVTKKKKKTKKTKLFKLVCELESWHALEKFLSIAPCPVKLLARKMCKQIKLGATHPKTATKTFSWQQIYLFICFLANHCHGPL